MRVVIGYFIVGLALGAGIIGGITPARADESPFSSIYTTETELQGEAEAEQWVTWASRKTDERFDKVAERTDFRPGSPLRDENMVGHARSL